MIPQKLTVQAFGPYVKAQTLDFTRLTSPIFLIYGKTGSGKSAILDAITFALYDKSSGGGRDKLEQMRSASAPRELDTIIEFTFELRGTLYKFERRLVCKKKAEGFNTIQSVSYKDELGWHACFANPKLKDLEQKVEEITGLTYEQFRQVIILPQGQFENLLVASSREKGEILRTLFGTQKYDAAAQNICEQANEMFGELKLLKTRQDELLSSCEVGSAQELSENIDAKECERQAIIKQQKNLNIESLEKEYVLAQTLMGVFSDLQACESQISDLQKYEDVIVKAQSALNLAVRADAVNIHYIAYAAAEKRLAERLKNLNELKSQITICEQSLINWQAEYKTQTQTEDVSASILELQSLEKIYSNLSAVEHDASELNKKLQTAKSEYDALERKFTEIKANNEAAKQLKQELFDNFVSKLPEYKALAQKHKRKAELVLAIKARDKQISELRAELSELQAKYEQKNKEYIHIYDAFLNTTAARLAQDLEEGKPCPVCGSTHHVSKPTQTDHISEAQVTKLSGEKDKLYKSIQVSQSKFESLQRQNEADKQEHSKIVVPDNIEGKLSEALKKQAQYDSITIDDGAAVSAENSMNAARALLDKLTGEYTTAFAKLEALQSQKHADIKDHTHLTEQINILTHIRDEREKAIEHARAEYEQANIKLVAAQTSLKHGQSEHQAAQTEYDDLKRAFNDALSKQGFEHQQAFIDALLDDAKKAKYTEKIQSYKDKSYHLSQTHATLTAQLTGKVKPDIKSLSAELENARQAHGELLRKIAATEALINTWRKHEDALRKLEKQYDEMFKTYLKLNDFGKLLRGDRGISLERYVLGVMLSAVTHEANKLLKHVHEGRYQLLRSMKKQGRQQQSGLDLEVLDAYSGQTRPVAGLSGGEKFLVATALCLGLSLVVQTQQGGINIDTMFIDEGFGSLDNSSIDDELYILSIGGCRVGLISHVAELKETIPCAIEVNKKSSGSEIRIVS